MARLQVRLPGGEHERLVEAARRDGVAVSEFVRRAVSDRIEGRTTRAIARAVSNELLPELERLLDSARVNTQTFAPTLAVPRPFDRGCFDADLHKADVLCESCGGRFF